MKLRVLIADDEPLAIDRLRTLLMDVEDVEIVATARNGHETVEQVGEAKPDLVLLDIQMPGRTGLAAAAAIAGEDGPEIVFVTAHEQFGPDAFDLEAADYLLKPVRHERLRVAVERARRRRVALQRAAAMQAPSDTAPSDFNHDIWVPVRDGQIRVPVASIEWIEAAKDYAMLHTSLRSYMLRTTMAQLAERIDPKQLVRVHRSAFVRPSAISEMRKSGRSVQIVLNDGIVIPVSINYVATLEDRLGLRT